MPWIEPAESRTLSQSEMEENAKMIWAFFQSKGWSLQAVSGMLGNMQHESSINPTRWQSDIPGEEGGGGYGLVQWTPWTNLIGRAQGIGFSDWETGVAQVNVINWEFDNGIQYYPTNAYPLTAQEFKVSTESPYYLAMSFINNYERPYDPDQPSRGVSAEQWYSFLQGEPPVQVQSFVERYSASGMQGSKYWYTPTNPFYPNFGLPNCTAYCWGRAWEIADTSEPTIDNPVPSLPLGNASEWWGSVNTSVYTKSQEPNLGSVICWDNGDLGHVAIVEYISEDKNTIVTSNSDYGGRYFYTMELKRENNWKWTASYEFQGFIKLPWDFEGDVPPPPPEPVVYKRATFPWFMFV